MTGGEGGEPVCWMDRVCPDCGLLAEDDLPTTCARCGATVPSDAEPATKAD